MMHKRAAVLTISLLTAGGASAGIAAMGNPAVEPTPTHIPALDDPPGVLCAVNYPEQLAEFPIAFAGTILSQPSLSAADQAKRGDRESNAAPFDVVIRVDQAFAGDLGRTVVMHGWDFDLSTPPGDRAGQRFLIAATETMDLMRCGYTRPYNEQDAKYWEVTFQGGGSSPDGDGPDMAPPAPAGSVLDETPYR